MNCDGVRGLLSAYLDGELSPGELLRVEQHLRRCHCCADEVDSLRQTIALVASLDEVEVPAIFHAQLHERLVALGPPVAGARRIPAAPSWQRSVRRWAVPAAAAAAALAIGLTAYPQAKELAGLEAPSSRFVANNTPAPSQDVTKQSGQTTQTPTATEQGKQEPTRPVANGDTTGEHGGGKSTAPPESSATPTTGSQVQVPGEAQTVSQTPPKDPAPVKLTPKVTYSLVTTATVTAPESLLQAVAGFAPRVDGDTVSITVTAAQRDAVVAAIRSAPGVKLAVEPAFTSQDLAGQMNALDAQVGTYQQQLSALEKQIPKLSGTAREDAFGQAKVLQEKLDNANSTLQRLSGQVDKAFITVHFQVQGR